MNKILVIEDEPIIRKKLLTLLRAEGFETISSDNGNSGVKLAQNQQPDLIICDIIIPQLDGYGVLKTLQEDPVTAAIPFIFLSSKADWSDWRMVMRLGADDYLIKPVKREELLDAIATRLQKRLYQTKRHHLELKKVQAQLNYLLRYDQVTNLPNRLLLEERFNQLLLQRQGRYRRLPVLSLSFDQLNQINNTLGPVSGDLLLQAVAKRLLGRVGPLDTVAQLGIDQFVILLATTINQTEIGQMAETLIDALSLPFTIGEYEIVLTPRIGIACFGRDALDLNTLITHANGARENAGQKGQKAYEFYIASIGDKSQQALWLELQLRQALPKDELQVYYQPKVNLRTGEIEGAEALIRWHHRALGAISPAKFIPLAEKTGLIVPLGEWVLRKACTQAKLWQTQGLSPVQIAVNLSGHQFNQPNLSNSILAILEETELDPRYLQLELTESTLMDNPNHAIATLKELKSFGIQISIDDFGTGYCSLSYLRLFPFDVLKIDRSFVCQLTEDVKNEAITTAILQMAHSLNLKVVAEGVETASQLAFLCGHKCDEIQGYCFSPPLSAPTFTEWLSTGKRLSLSSLG
ncbi:MULTISPECIES: EAL domain-containing response regulator [Moorena]|uniref:Diguanylate cyclase GGDEF domain protein n=1 Tax=Moorena producens 3L TaxID=489825 RepID=F4XQ39_9CYAN|nr:MULTISPECIES: EAL domain-containing response regulator [Moorena]EGJ33268.1 diguanylate cyclase GGDEF domain protein [Moorena producens 3L]NEP35561.1 EAL domain-containing protein [Moorena sp. SIO3B2]NEP66619.1 EAL domain-containing protein [Moorena sp. SIO3A5]NEQ09418.1 EAL domain-containing protein [Moorena sp. SIO4E2]NER90611.1 EAL domain-containing protein [Moorena sp. SIO3A2]